MEENNNLEARIIETARKTFIEKGYAETSISDIAAQVGINRPTLHYYFRTKDRLFNAVFGDIIRTLAPKVQEVLRRSDLPISERIGQVVDAYFTIFRNNTNLPLFIVRELNRNYDFVANFVVTLHFNEYIMTIGQTLENEMNEGKLKQVPLRYVFLTFYSLLTMPFSVRPLCENALLEDGETFDEMLDKWKPYIIKVMGDMLEA